MCRHEDLFFRRLRRLWILLHFCFIENTDLIRHDICDAFGITLSQFFADGEESVVLTPSQRKMLDKWNCLTEAQHNSLLILMDSM